MPPSCWRVHCCGGTAAGARLCLGADAPLAAAHCLLQSPPQAAGLPAEVTRGAQPASSAAGVDHSFFNHDPVQLLQAVQHVLHLARTAAVLARHHLRRISRGGDRMAVRAVGRRAGRAQALRPTLCPQKRSLSQISLARTDTAQAGWPT